MSLALPRFPVGSLLATLLLAVTVRADEPQPTATAPAQPELRKIEGIFNTDLPKTERKGSVRLVFHPHFGDFTSRSYLRVATGVRWGVNDHTELNVLLEPYFEHHLKSGHPGNGVGDVQLGFKYGFRDKLIPGYDTSAGLNIYRPVGHPPLDMTNGYNRYSPYFVISKKIDEVPGLVVFLNSGLNLLSKSSVPGTFDKNEAHSNSVIFTPGFVYDRYPFHYTLEVSYETTALIGSGNKTFLTVRPGIAWDLPRSLKFNSRGRWLIGFGFHATFGPDGTTTGTGAKLRAEFGISRWFHRSKKDYDEGTR